MERINTKICFELTYGLAPNGKLIPVVEAERGLKCNCKCPNCNLPLEARKGNKRKAHFAHYGGKKDKQDLKTCYMTALHKLAEQIICEKKCVMLPSMSIIPERIVYFEKVELEKRIDRPDLQPDIVGITHGGDRYLIEIKNTSAVNDEKKEKIYTDDLKCLEIDVSKQTLDGLEDFLILSSKSRIWINNSEYVREIMKHYRKNGSALGKNISFCKNKCQYRLDCEFMRWKRDTVTYMGKLYNICRNPNINKEKDIDKGVVNQEKVEVQSFLFSDMVVPEKIHKKYEPKYCLCPWQKCNNTTIFDEYYNLLKPNIAFYDDGIIKTKILNYYKGENKFVVIHADINDKSKYIFRVTGVYMSNNHIVHQNISKQDLESKATNDAKIWLNKQYN